MPEGPLLLRLIAPVALVAVFGLAGVPAAEAAVELITEVETEAGPGTTLYSSNPEAGAAGATAGRGSLSVGTRADVSGAVGGTTYQTGARSSATFRVDDLVFGGPENTVLAPTRLRVAGFLNATGIRGGLGGVEAQATVFVEAILQPPEGGLFYDVFSGWRRIDYFENSFGPSSTTEDAGGFWTGPYDGDEVYTSTPTHPVPILTPLVLLVTITCESLAIATGAEGQSGFSANGACQFDHTLEFPRDRPVFDLPVGFTANSEQAHIVDNYYVPEPSAGWLGMAALAALHACRRAWSRPAASRRSPSPACPHSSV